jgi:hypothetical protein
MPNSHLVQKYAIPTSGARAVEHFTIEDETFLAIPQLAYDVSGEPANMNGGDSNTDLLLLRRRPTGFDVVDRLSVPGGEDAEFFQLGDRSFLATASIRSGTGPYDFAVESTIFEWIDGRFESFQTVPTYAAKQWRFFEIGERPFLAVAQGVTLPGHETNNQPSRIYEWNGERFQLFQDLTLGWGYNWHPFTIGERFFLAHADHVRPSTIFEWNGEQFLPIQDVAPEHGRAFATFNRAGETYLLAAIIQGSSLLLRWDGQQFVHHQSLERPGAREFAAIEDGDKLFVLRVNFIEGTPADPTTALSSQVYEWEGGKLIEIEQFATEGACDITTWTDPVEGRLVAVSNSLTPDVRFGNNVAVYRFHD